MAATKLANIRHGNVRAQGFDRSIDRSKPLISQEKAAEAMQVGVTTVGRAKRLLATATPEIIEKVEEGSMTIHEALSLSAPVAKPLLKLI